MALSNAGANPNYVETKKHLLYLAGSKGVTVRIRTVDGEVVEGIVLDIPCPKEMVAVAMDKKEPGSRKVAYVDLGYVTTVISKGLTEDEPDAEG
ncbi:hypothetical protein [Rhodococcus ruber]|uniref:hypothetical protein n=1 Tax=Rhodococcus ruber TaxID=1830 RepID=UPI001F48B4E7|nr:hypothetical protein [Rhodococcus ruber]MCF8785746.1 hypothetical protein [Rhodococcus ruber]